MVLDPYEHMTMKAPSSLSFDGSIVRFTCAEETGTIISVSQNFGDEACDHNVEESSGSGGVLSQKFGAL